MFQVLHTLDKTALPRTLVPVAVRLSSLPPDAFVAYFMVVKLLDGRTLRSFHRFSEASPRWRGNAFYRSLSFNFWCLPTLVLLTYACCGHRFQLAQVKDYVATMARVLGSPLVEIGSNSLARCAAPPR